MHDEHDMYRVQRPTLRRQLYHLCLRSHGTILFDVLCNCRTSTDLPSNSGSTALGALFQPRLVFWCSTTGRFTKQKPYGGRPMMCPCFSCPTVQS